MLDLIYILFVLVMTFVFLTRNFDDQKLKLMQLASIGVTFVLFIIGFVFFITKIGHVGSIFICTIFHIVLLGMLGSLYLRPTILDNKMFEVIAILALVGLYLLMPYFGLERFVRQASDYFEVNIILSIYSVVSSLMRILLVVLSIKRYRLKWGN